MLTTITEDMDIFKVNYLVHVSTHMMKILMQSGVFICTQGKKIKIKKCIWVMLKTYPATELKPFELARLSHGVSTTMNGSYSRTCLSTVTHTEFHDHMTLNE